jgi:cell division protein FtsI/penicillin-binding protein 2
MFGKQTGIEQGYEAPGYVPSPTDGFGLDITYANTAFGQGLNITPLQMLAAFSSTINGGNYYRPHLVADTDNSKSLVKKGVVKPELSPVIRDLHESTVHNNYTFLKRDGYHVGGKTGTAQIPKPGGGYYDDRFYGTFVGFVGGNKPEYVIMVTVNNPRTGTYAGISGAAPLFEQAEDMLISNYAVDAASQ